MSASLIDWSTVKEPELSKGASDLLFVKPGLCPLVLAPVSTAITWIQFYDPTTKKHRPPNDGEKGTRRYAFHAVTKAGEFKTVVTGTQVWGGIVATMKTVVKMGGRAGFVKISTSGAGKDTEYRVEFDSPVDAASLRVPETARDLEDVRAVLLGLGSRVNVNQMSPASPT